MTAGEADSLSAALRSRALEAAPVNPLSTDLSPPTATAAPAPHQCLATAQSVSVAQEETESCADRILRNSSEEFIERHTPLTTSAVISPGSAESFACVLPCPTPLNRCCMCVAQLGWSDATHTFRSKSTAAFL